MNKQTEALKLARDCGINFHQAGWPELERFAALVAAAEQKRSDALAATINALREVVTTDTESKADFVARVRDVLGNCHDTRVLHAVAAEREACAQECEHTAVRMGSEWMAHHCAAAIRARKENT